MLWTKNGSLCFALGAIIIVVALAPVSYVLLVVYSESGSIIAWRFLYLLGPGVFLVLLGVIQRVLWIIGRGRRDRGRCKNCGYELKGLTDVGCPECGWKRDPFARDSTPEQR
jgi:hypothetical protein